MLISTADFARKNNPDDLPGDVKPEDWFGYSFEVGVAGWVIGIVATILGTFSDLRRM